MIEVLIIAGCVLAPVALLMLFYLLRDEQLPCVHCGQMFPADEVSSHADRCMGPEGP